MKKTILTLMLVFASASVINATVQDNNQKCNEEKNCNTKVECCEKTSCDKEKKCDKQCCKKPECDKTKKCNDCCKSDCRRHDKKHNRDRMRPEKPGRFDMNKAQRPEMKFIPEHEFDLSMQGIELNDEQKQKIEELNRAQKSKMGKIQVETKKSVDKAKQDYDKKMKKILSEEQYQKYLQNKEIKAKHHKDKKNKKCHKNGKHNCSKRSNEPAVNQK